MGSGGEVMEGRAEVQLLESSLLGGVKSSDIA